MPLYLPSSSGTFTLSGTTPCSLAAGHLSSSGSLVTSSSTVPATDLSGTIAAGRMPALTGDVTTSAGSVATTVGSSFVKSIDAITSTSNIGASSTSEVQLYGFTIPGVTLANYHSYRLNASGYYFNNSGATRTVTFRLKYAGTTLWGDATAIQVNSSTLRIAFFVDCWITAPTSSTISAGGRIVLSDNAGGSVAGYGDFNTAEAGVTLATAGPQSISSASDQTFEVTIQMPTSNANLYFRCEMGQGWWCG